MKTACFLLFFWLASSIGFPVLEVPNLLAAPPALAAPKMGIIVPAYFYPAGEGEKEWTRLAAVAKTMPLVVIIDPDNGPGTRVDPNYQKVLKLISETGATPIGYISTSYGKRDGAQISADAKTWLKFYPEIQGYFLDEQTSDEAHAPELLKNCQALRALRPKGPIVSNPGNPCAAGYFQKGGPDVICVYERSIPLEKYIPAAETAKLPPMKFGGLVYAQADEVLALKQIELAHEKNLGWLFVTNSNLPNPWDRLRPILKPSPKSPISDLPIAAVLNHYTTRNR